MPSSGLHSPLCSGDEERGGNFPPPVTKGAVSEAPRRLHKISDVWQACMDSLRHWLEVTTSSTYLVSELSRRQARMRSLPAIVSVIVLVDVFSFLSNTSSRECVAALVLDGGVLVPAALLGRAGQNLAALWPDCCLAIVGSLTLLSVGNFMIQDVELVMQVIPTGMVISCAVGFNAVCTIALFFVSLLLGTVLPPASSSDHVSLVQFVQISALTCAACLFMDYVVASSHMKLEQRDAEKQQLLDLATDGWGTVCSSSYRLTAVSEKLLDTLQRQDDILGVPIQALVRTEDHVSLKEVLQAGRSSRRAKEDREDQGHALLTFKTADLEFDARFIVHGGPSTSTSAASVAAVPDSLNFCLVIVGEPRRGVLCGTGTASISSGDNAMNSKSKRPGGRMRPPISGLMQRPRPVPVRSSRSSRRSQVSAAMSDTTSDSEECEVGTVDLAASLFEEVRVGVHLRTVGIQTPQHLAATARRDLAGLTAFSSNAAFAANPGGPGGSRPRKRRIGARRQVNVSALRLGQFDPTPFATRRKALSQLMRSWNTGLLTECCSTHSCWYSLVEVVQHNLEIPCEKLESAYSDWQCPQCRAMNEKPRGDAVNLPTWRCALCNEMVQPFLGYSSLAL